jgi:hypothetical protein
VSSFTGAGCHFYLHLQPLVFTGSNDEDSMAPARSTEAALRAEIFQLQTQLSAERRVARFNNQLLASKDQMLAKNEALLAMKDEVMALKSKLLKQGSMNKDDETATSQRKRQCVGDSSGNDVAAALDKDEILDQIFSYVGGGDHLYVAGVNRKWRSRYTQYCVQSTSSVRDEKYSTKYRSAIITESRLLQAKSNGLSIKECFDLIGQSDAQLICEHSVEPEQVLKILSVHSVPWGDALCSAAAYYNRFEPAEVAVQQ